MVENERSVSCIPSKQAQCMQKISSIRQALTVSVAAYVWLLSYTLGKVIKPQQEPPLAEYVTNLINLPVVPPAGSDWRSQTEWSAAHHPPALSRWFHCAWLQCNRQSFAFIHQQLHRVVPCNVESYVCFKTCMVALLWCRTEGRQSHKISFGQTHIETQSLLACFNSSMSSGEFFSQSSLHPLSAWGDLAAQIWEKAAPDWGSAALILACKQQSIVYTYIAV